MREILFRGKSIYTCKWGESVCPLGMMHSGHLCDDFIPETVGQFTGLTDKNGKKIFEGDIVRYVNPDGDAISGTVSYGEHAYSGTHDIGFYVEWQRPGWAMHLRDDLGFWTNFRKIEVIGNIHDNPERLNGGAEDGK